MKEDLKTFEEFKNEYMENANQINEHKEIWRAVEHFFSNQSRRLDQLQNELLEFMGYEDSYLKTQQGLMRYKKEELVAIILRQRAIYRKLLQDMDEETKVRYIQELDSIYMQK